MVDPEKRVLISFIKRRLLEMRKAMWKGKIRRHCYFTLNRNNKNVGYSLFPVSKGVGDKTEISHFQFLLHIFKDGKLLQVTIFML